MSNNPVEDDLDLIASPEGAVLQRTNVLDAGTVKKRSVAGVLSFFLRTVLLSGVTIIAQLLLGAKLSPEDFGVYGLVVTITNFFTIISDVGLAASLIQKKEEPTVEDLRTTFTVQQILAWVVFTLIALTSGVLYAYAKIQAPGFYLALAFALSFPIVSLKTISSILLERELAFGKLVIPAIIESVVFNVIAVTLAFSGYGLVSFTVAVIVKAIIGVVVMLGIKRWDIGFSFSLTAFKELMKIGGAFQLNDMLAKAKDDLFYITVALLIPAREFGYITWAKQWSRFPYSLTVDNVSAITFPAFARLQHDQKLLQRAVEKSIFLITLLAFPMLVGISVIAPSVTTLVPEYIKWKPALLPLGLFSFSLAFSAFSTPLINTLNAIGKITESLRMMVFWTLAQWVLFPFLFIFFGYQSIAIISLILGISSLFVVQIVKKHVYFSFIENIWRQAFASVIMAVIVFVLQDVWAQSASHLFLGISVGGIVYTSFMVLFGGKKLSREILSLLRK